MREKIIKSLNPYALLDKTHCGKWVLFNADCTKLLAVSDSFPDITGMDGKDILIMKVLPDVSYIPTTFILREV